MALRKYYKDLLAVDRNLELIKGASVQDILKGAVKSYGLNGSDEIKHYGLCWEKRNRIKALNYKIDSNNLNLEDIAYLKQNLYKINWKGFEEEFGELKEKIQDYGKEQRQDKSLYIPKTSPIYRLYTNNLQNINELDFLDKNLNDIHWNYFKVTQEDVTNRVNSVWNELEKRLDNVNSDLILNRDTIKGKYLDDLNNWIKKQNYSFRGTKIENNVLAIAEQINQIRQERKLVNRVKKGVVFFVEKLGFGKFKSKYADRLVTVSGVANVPLRAQSL